LHEVKTRSRGRVGVLAPEHGRTLEPRYVRASMRDLRRAFPGHLGAEVEAVLAVLPAGPPPTDWDIGPIELGGERLSIPDRIYQPELVSSRSLSETSQRVVAALYTRHHDGSVRERHLRSLLAAREPWIAPFVVQLLGEYVLEIVEVIAEAHAAEQLLEHPAFRDFARESRSFIELTERRAISRWSQLHRARYPRKELYPALRLLRALASPPGTPGAPYR
jgi:hypothetical protein